MEGMGESQNVYEKKFEVTNEVRFKQPRRGNDILCQIEYNPGDFAEFGNNMQKRRLHVIFYFDILEYICGVTFIVFKILH